MDNPKLPCPTEDVEQAHLFTWAAWMEVKYPELKYMYHIPNGGKRSKSEAARFKIMGVKPGVPDIFLPAPKWIKTLDQNKGSAQKLYCGLYIELKRRYGGTATDNQNDWLRDMRKQGYAAEVCQGAEVAKRVIMDYLDGDYAPVYIIPSRKEAKKK